MTISAIESAINSAEFVSNPYPTYARLRREAPVYWCEAWGCWLISRYEDARVTLTDHKRFSSYRRLTTILEKELPESMLEKIQPLISHYSLGLINVDPPDHTRMRKLVHQGFTPRAIQKMRGHIQDIVRQLLQDAHQNETMDIVRDLAFPLPVTVIAEMMGVPASERETFKNWSGRIIEFMATPRPSAEILERSQNALLELRDYFRTMAARRHQDPRDDLITALAFAQDEGDRLTEEEMLSTCVTILIGGHETTTSLISSATLRLLQHPDQLQRMKEKPEVIECAVEEFLRFDAPFQRNRRVVTEDTEIGGQKIKRGDLLMQLLGSANHDPEQFENPAKLDIERSPNKHLSFGSGVHFCLGAALARLEAQVALPALFQSEHRFELADQPLRWRDGLMRGLLSLEVCWVA